MTGDDIAAQAGRDPLRLRLMRSIDGIEKTLRDHADEAETLGTLPEPSWRALHDAGLFLLKAPREAGGIEADPVLQIEVIERLACIDTSAGWTAMIGSGSLALMSAWLPDAGLQEVRVEGRLPRVAGGVMPNGTATRVAGGYMLSGRWQFGSGSAHAQWLLGNGFVASGEPRTPKMFVFPASVARVHQDSWNVRALRGTGSYDISVSEVFVPEHRTADIFSPALRGGPFYRRLRRRRADRAAQRRCLCHRSGHRSRPRHVPPCGRAIALRGQRGRALRSRRHRGGPARHGQRGGLRAARAGPARFS